jgi:hypothetical protein
MRRVKLQFASPDDLWNFLVLTKIRNVEVVDSVIEGFFTARELEIATAFLKAEQFSSPVMDVSGEGQSHGFYLR